MSRDIIADVLNEIMNAKRAKKEELVVNKLSNLLVKVLDRMQQYGYLEYVNDEGKIKITLKNLTECRAIKPRYSVGKKKIDGYMRRFLPARNFGYMLISTSKGIMTHEEAQENKIGGSLIAYFY